MKYNLHWILTLYPLSLFYILTHLKLCLAAANHNFRRVRISHICSIWGQIFSIIDDHCWNIYLITNNSDLIGQQNGLKRTSQKAVSAHLISKQILPFGCVEQHSGHSKQTHNICITFIQRRPNVFYTCTNVLCLLGLKTVISSDRDRHTMNP